MILLNAIVFDEYILSNNKNQRSELIIFLYKPDPH